MSARLPGHSRRFRHLRIESTLHPIATAERTFQIGGFMLINETVLAVERYAQAGVWA
jgi:hypothetical protein